MRRALVGSLAALLLSAPPAHAAKVSQEVSMRASDGVRLQATVTGENKLKPRPLIVEFSPYGRAAATLDPGPAFNYLTVQVRGTGGSNGRFSAFGPRMQRDVKEVLAWACRQPWSNGALGLNGFSASAIAIYNSLHLKLPCVKGAVLKSGTFSLYRDLIWPGGINNAIPAMVVMAGIGAASLAQSFDHSDEPLSGTEVIAGMFEAGLGGLSHQTLDEWWRERGFRGDANDLPILMINGFFDVESRGAFQAYQQLRGDGAHLLVVGAHEGAPAGTDAGLGEARAWLDRYVRGVPNGVEDHPRVQLWLSDGDREDYLGGRFVRFDGNDWPIPGTRWQALSPTPASEGDSLVLGRGRERGTQVYPSVPSLPTHTDVPNTAVAGAAGFNAFSNAFPFMTETNLSEVPGLSYTTAPLAGRVLAAGPASLELRLSSTAPETGIWAVISDVHPDGTAHPVAAGRLSSAYPRISRKRSLVDGRGRVVQPYGVFDRRTPAEPAESRLYRVEFWPIGNRFRTGHRIRLSLFGVSALSAPGAPALNAVSLGGPDGARLLFPVLPGSDLREVLP